MDLCKELERLVVKEANKEKLERKNARLRAEIQFCQDRLTMLYRNKQECYYHLKVLQTGMPDFKCQQKFGLVPFDMTIKKCFRNLNKIDRELDREHTVERE